MLNTNAFGPWATTLANDTVTVNNVASPIYSVGNVSGVEQLTFQVPCETAAASSVPITVNVGGGSATVNLPVQAATPGIFQTVMSDGVRRAVVDPARWHVSSPCRIRRAAVKSSASSSPVWGRQLRPSLPVRFLFAGVDSLILGQVIVGVEQRRHPRRHLARFAQSDRRLRSRVPGPVRFARQATTWCSVSPSMSPATARRGSATAANFRCPVVRSTRGEPGSPLLLPYTLSSPSILFTSIGSMPRNRCSSGCVSLTPFPISDICKKLLAIREAFTILWVVAKSG